MDKIPSILVVGLLIATFTSIFTTPYTLPSILGFVGAYLLCYLFPIRYPSREEVVEQARKGLSFLTSPFPYLIAVILAFSVWYVNQA